MDHLIGMRSSHEAEEQHTLTPGVPGDPGSPGNPIAPWENIEVTGHSSTPQLVTTVTS